MTSWKPALNKAALEILFYFYNNCLENTVVYTKCDEEYTVGAQERPLWLIFRNVESKTFDVEHYIANQRHSQRRVTVLS